MDSNFQDCAYITCVTNEKYILPAVILKESIKRTGSHVPFFVLIDKKSDNSLMTAIKKNGLNIILVDVLDPPFSFEEYQRKELLNCYYSFIKLSFYQLHFKKIILLDSDTLVFRNIDHLFNYPNLTSVISGKCSHPGWQDLCAGLIVLEPTVFSHDVINKNVINAVKFREKENGHGLIGDQDVFTVFNDFHFRRNNSLHLPEIYQCLDHEVDLVLKTLKKNKRDIFLVHYASSPKIWTKSKIQIVKNQIFRLLRFRFGEFYVVSYYAKLLKKAQCYGKQSKCD